VRKTVLQNLFIYAIAAAIVWYVARGVSWGQVIGAASRSTLWLFAGASLGGFLCWFGGETVLYSRLFTYFHEQTESLELLPTTATVYFLQLVNSYVASGAYVLFLHTRKRVPWVTSACTLLFLAYVDVTLLSILTLVAIAIVPTSPIRLGLNYAAGLLGGAAFIASFWLFWGARLGADNWLKWIYERPSMVSFRIARPSHYIKLLGIRFLIVLCAGFSLYGQLVSFHISLPLTQALALTPLIVAIGTSPVSPGGIGTTQLVFTLAFAPFAGKGDLFAVSLAVTAFNFLVRIPMGAMINKPLAGEAAEVQRELIAKRTAGQA
jgi:uncharacterized membrane protein YbhN (UPF0104 family)